MFSSCCSKAAVPFRWRFTAVGTLSCADSLMLLPLTSKTRTRGWAVKLFSLVYWKKLCPCDCNSLSESLWRPPPPSLSALELETPSSASLLLSLFTAHYSVQVSGGHWGEGDAYPFILFVISSGWWPRTSELDSSFHHWKKQQCN